MHDIAEKYHDICNSCSMYKSLRKDKSWWHLIMGTGFSFSKVI